MTNKEGVLPAVNRGLMKTSRRYLTEVSKHWQLYMLLALPAIQYVVFQYIPLYWLTTAFKDTSYIASKGIWGIPWIGFNHFIRFFDSPDFWQVIKNTIVLNAIGLCAFPIPIIFALQLYEVKYMAGNVNNFVYGALCQRLFGKIF